MQGRLTKAKAASQQHFFSVISYESEKTGQYKEEHIHCMLAGLNGEAHRRTIKIKFCKVYDNS